MAKLYKQARTRPITSLVHLPLSRSQLSPVENWLDYEFTRYHTHTTDSGVVATFAYPCLHTSPVVHFVSRLMDPFHVLCIHAARGRHWCGLGPTSPFGNYFFEFRWLCRRTGNVCSVSRQCLVSGFDILSARQCKSESKTSPGGTQASGDTLNETLMAYSRSLDFLARAEQELYFPRWWEPHPPVTAFGGGIPAPPTTPVVYDDQPFDQTISDYVFQVASELQGAAGSWAVPAGCDSSGNDEEPDWEHVEGWNNTTSTLVNI